jgi:hypothetical protein
MNAPILIECLHNAPRLPRLPQNLNKKTQNLNDKILAVCYYV